MRRQTLGMTQRSLGTALGVKFQQIQNYEKARNRIGSSRLHQVAAILQVTPQFFFEGAPKSQTGHSKRNVPPSPVPLVRFLATPDWYRFGQGIHAHRSEASPPDCRSRADNWPTLGEWRQDHERCELGLQTEPLRHACLANDVTARNVRLTLEARRNA